MALRTEVQMSLIVDIIEHIKKVKKKKPEEEEVIVCDAETYHDTRSALDELQKRDILCVQGDSVAINDMEKFKLSRDVGKLMLDMANTNSGVLDRKDFAIQTSMETPLRLHHQPSPNLACHSRYIQQL